MPTIDNPQIIMEIMNSDGHFHDDPRAFAILGYVNAWGGNSTAICYSPEDRANYYSSPFVSFAITLWDQLNGITPMGEYYIEQHTSGEEE